MKIGFTGTRKGMTENQAAGVTRAVMDLAFRYGEELMEFHHGDCMGADAQINAVLKRGFPFGIKRVSHPPANSSLRAFCEVHEAREPKEYLARNRDIVTETDCLIAAPGEGSRGTWYTVRYAEKVGKPVTVVRPDGCAVTLITVHEGWGEEKRP